MKSKVLPENILKCMSPETRSPLGKAGKTSAEAIAKHEYGQERKLHQQIKQLLDIKNLMYVYSRTDKRTTVSKGFPDFCIFRPNSSPMMVEVKVGTNKLSEDQLIWAKKYFECTSGLVFTVRSLEELKALI